MALADLPLLLKFAKDSASIWRFNLESKEIKQLTFGVSDREPDCTPDGKSLVFITFNSESRAPAIGELPEDGGSPKQLAQGIVWSPRVSRDRKAVAYLALNGEGSKATSNFVVRSLADNSVREIPAPEGSSQVDWTPDGRSLSYLLLESNSVNLRVQPLDGRKSIQIMHFDDEPAEIAAYAWSRDGKKIAVTRKRFNDADVVLFTGLR